MQCAACLSGDEHNETWDEVWGRGGSCVAMTIQIAMDDSSDKSIVFSKGEGNKSSAK